MSNFKNYKFSFSFGPQNVHFRIELSLSISLSCKCVEMAEMAWCIRFCLVLVNGGVKGASDSQPSNSLVPFYKDQARITMVVGRVGSWAQH